MPSRTSSLRPSSPNYPAGSSDQPSLPGPSPLPSAPPGTPWTFLSNHAHVLVCIAADPEARMRDVAQRVGVTERAVQRIVTELEEGGYLLRRKEGRRNHYEVTASRPLRHPLERHCTTDALLAMVLGSRQH
jgi:DNA-binding transcriptional ArsR family regulator